MSEANNKKKESEAQWKTEMRRSNLEYAESINKWGNFDEAIVFPDLPKIIQKKFPTKTMDIGLRRIRCLDNGQTETFGVIAISDEYIFLNRSFHTLTHQDVDAFVEEIKLFFKVFPEYRNKKLIGTLTSLYFDESELAYAEQNGFLVLGIGLQFLEIKNRSDFEPKRWSYNA